MIPYKITQAKLTTYSGRVVPVEIESVVFTEPLRRVKDKMLDAFISMCKESKDPFVKIEVKTKELISWK
jgi:hypothetical protein